MEGSKHPAVVKDLCRFIVTSISIGDNHTAVLIEGGKVITFGRNVEGQLGFGGNRNQQGLVHVKQLDQVTSTVSVNRESQNALFCNSQADSGSGSICDLDGVILGITVQNCILGMLLLKSEKDGLFSLTGLI